jgi:phage-related protein
LHYVPKAEDIYIWNNEYDTHDLEVDGHDGGYWYSTTVKPKVFELECYFEEITHLQMKKIQSLFSRGRTGALVFDERPFLSYTATVTEFPKPEVYIGNSGLLNVQLTAYYPFAVMDRLFVVDFEEYGSEYEELVRDTTGVLTEAKTPVNIIDTTPALTTTTSFLLYNPGDARADTIIRIAGDVATGVSIHNAATGQTCTVKGITKALTSNVSKWLEIDSGTGKVYLTDGTTPVMSFLYHDNSFIQLEGAAPIDREIRISYTGNVVTSVGEFTPDMEGKYILIGSTWRKITDYFNADDMEIEYTYGAPGTATSDIATMNYITVTPATTMEITKLEFHYYPTCK